MGRKAKRGKANRAKTRLGLPDLEYAKSAVLVSLRSPESQRSYRRSINDFVCWYCSSHGYLSTRPSSRVTGFILRVGCWHLEPSTSGWRQCDAWPTRQRTQGS